MSNGGRSCSSHDSARKPISMDENELMKQCFEESIELFNDIYSQENNLRFSKRALPDRFENGKRIIDVTHLLHLPQPVAAKKVGLPWGTFVTHFRRNKKCKKVWPSRDIARYTHEIKKLIASINVPNGENAEEELGNKPTTVTQKAPLKFVVKSATIEKMDELIKKRDDAFFSSEISIFHAAGK